MPAYLEDAGANPFLARFYESPVRWAFESQEWFIEREVAQHKLIAGSELGGIQDRSHYESVDIFAPVLHEAGYLTDEDLRSIRHESARAGELLPPPSLVVFLDAPTDELLARIRARDSVYERTIEPDYLDRLNTRTQEYFARWTISPLLIVDTKAHDLREEHERAEVRDSIARIVSA
jgi:deoxyadenosine/deoxycytidine kinase